MVGSQPLQGSAAFFSLEGLAGEGWQEFQEPGQPSAHAQELSTSATPTRTPSFCGLYVQAGLSRGAI